MSHNKDSQFKGTWSVAVQESISVNTSVTPRLEKQGEKRRATLHHAEIKPAEVSPNSAAELMGLSDRNTVYNYRRGNTTRLSKSLVEVGVLRWPSCDMSHVRYLRIRTTEDCWHKTHLIGGFEPFPENHNVAVVPNAAAHSSQNGLPTRLFCAPATWPLSSKCLP